MKHKFNVYVGHIAVLVAVSMACLAIGCDRDNRDSSKRAGASPVTIAPSVISA